MHGINHQQQQHQPQTENRTGEHLFFAEGGRGLDFIVYNSEDFSDEPIDPAGLKYVRVPNASRQRSEAWASNVKWFFVVQDYGIVLLNTFNDRGVVCPQKSYKFIEMFLHLAGKVAEDNKSGKHLPNTSINPAQPNLF